MLGARLAGPGPALAPRRGTRTIATGAFLVAVVGLLMLPLTWFLATNGHLISAMRLLGAAAVATGVTSFVHHGGRRITAAGTYCLAAGLMAGCGVWYWAGTTPQGATQFSVFLGALSIYGTTALMYLLFWARGADDQPDARPGDLMLSPARARSLGVLGLTLFALGVVSQHVSLGTLPTAFADVGVVAFAASLLLGGRQSNLWSPMRLALVGSAMLAYYLVVFTGGGRLRLVAIAIAIAVVAQARSPIRLKPVALVLLIPVIVLLAAIGRERLAVQHPNAQASAGGLGSLVNPIATYGELINERLRGGHGSSFVAEAVAVVPRAVWPSKPQQIGRTLALRLDPNAAAASKLSVAVMPQGEAYYNFGWSGLLLVVPVLGWLLAWLDRRLLRRSTRGYQRTSGLFGLIGLAVLVGSLTDLAWGGTATWTVRDAQRLLVLLPLLIWVLLGEGRSASPSVRPVGWAGEPPRLSRHVSLGETGAAKPASAPSGWSVPDLPPSIGALVGPEVAPSLPTAGTAARAAAFIVDEAFSSLQNFVIMFAALRFLSIGTLGIFTLAYTAALLVETVLRSFVLVPLSIRYSHASKAAQRAAGERAVGAAVVAGLTSVLIGGLGFAIWHGSGRVLFLATGAAVFALIVQEAWRVLFFTQARPWRAVMNDGFCLGGTAGLLGFVLLNHHHPSGSELMLLWAIGTGAGAVLGVVQAGLTPRVGAAWGWLRRHGRLGAQLAGAQAAERFSGQLAYALIAILAGSAALGEISASRTLISPFTTLVVAVSTFAVPEAARLIRHDAGRPRAFLAGVSLSLGLAIVGVGLALSFLPNHIGRFLVGGNWGAAKSELLPILIWTGANALRAGPTIGLQVTERVRVLLGLTTATAIATLVAVCGGAAAVGATGAAWGFAVVALVASAVYWVVFLRLRARPGVLSTADSRAVETGSRARVLVVSRGRALTGAAVAVAVVVAVGVAIAAFPSPSRIIRPGAPPGIAMTDSFQGPNRVIAGERTPSHSAYLVDNTTATTLEIRNAELVRTPAANYGPTGAPILIWPLPTKPVSVSARFVFTPGSADSQNVVIGTCAYSFGRSSVQLAVSPHGWVLFYTLERPAPDTGTAIVNIASGSLPTLAMNGRTSYQMEMQADLTNSSVRIEYPGGTRTISDPAIGKYWGSRFGVQIRRPHSPDGDAAVESISASSAGVGLTGSRTAVTITSILPASGPPGGGTTVSIFGSGFTDARRVLFGAAGPAAKFKVVSDSEIAATSPAGSVGPVNIRVTTPSGTSPANSTDIYRYTR